MCSVEGTSMRFVARLVAIGTVDTWMASPPALLTLQNGGHACAYNIFAAWECVWHVCWLVALPQRTRRPGQSRGPWAETSRDPDPYLSRR